MAESISLEETNALRAKLGLPALGGGAGDGDAEEGEEQSVDRDKEAYENYQKQKEEEEKQKKAEEIKARIEKSKNRKKNLEKLKGKGLGEVDNDENDDSALSWIRKSRKREKELAERRAREQAEMDDAFATSSNNGATRSKRKSTANNNYDADALSGLKVAHDVSEFAEGGETILTLKDRGILDDDHDENDPQEAVDELSNVNLEDKERLQKNLENKKKKPGYNPYDDEEFILGGKKKSLLPHYDEQTGPQGFQIGEQGRILSEQAQEKQQEQSVSEKLKAQTLSYQKMQEIKDYYTQDEVNLSFKKPKKKKKSKLRNKRTKQPEDEEDETLASTTSTTTEQPSKASSTTAKPKTIDTDTSFVDDDDLQMALSRTRRAVNRQREKKSKKMTPEEIARSIVAERGYQQGDDGQEGGGGGDNEDGGLVLSEMTEFVNSIGTEGVFTPREPARSVREAQAVAEKAASESPAAPMQGTEEAVTATTLQDVPEEEEESTQQSMTKKDAEEVKEEEEEEASTAIMEEPLVSKGMAATLSLLSQKGFVAKATEEQLKRDRDQASRMRWIAEQKKKDVQREREREQEKQRQRERDREYRGSNMQQRGGADRERAREREREREREKELEEREAMREFEKRMEEYKPDVKLEYYDEHGHQMNTKEAFRFMSHKFHGKTSGKTKTEKRMAKLEEELKLNMMSNNDTPLNLATKLLERQQRTGNAHVVLSVGNRGVAAPTDPELAAGASSSTSSTGKRARAMSEDDDDVDVPSDKKRK
ncbi:SART-1 protein [Zychaea mexicana]|uniref:SART-1 protein n=1 Tax=Zychaea mexicana TaxID=64656 RepID=UPI0022FE196B|nr:SART-1 protein [Zychaea mexicana]KAI9471359.1 SART-1 protein [Zychaea mexicana]